MLPRVCPGKNVHQIKLLAKPKAGRDCFWWPHSSASVLQCNGYKVSLCKVYGTNRLLEPPNMDLDKVKVARDVRRKDQKSAGQHLRNFKKKNQDTLEQNKINGTHPSKVNEMTAITDESIETLL